MDEQWRDIPGYEGYYQVSSAGRVKSLGRFIQDRYGMKSPYRIPPRILKPKTSSNGYQWVNLSVQGIARPCRIHRMVAELFVPNPDRLPTVNHKNEDKSDNRAENLEWCTQAYNNAYGTRTERSQMSQKQRRSVMMIAMDGKVLRTFPTLTAAARHIVDTYDGRKPSIKIADNNIRAVCHHRGCRHTAYGYKWEFSDLRQ